MKREGLNEATTSPRRPLDAFRRTRLLPSGTRTLAAEARTAAFWFKIRPFAYQKVHSDDDLSCFFL
jgi:hypothetical protein